MARSPKRKTTKSGGADAGATPGQSDGRSPEQRVFPVVGVGASAGGLEAFMQLLKALPPRIGMAIVLVPHLDPSHESAMTNLLARATNLPVTQVTNGMAIKPDQVYVIPPNTEMTTADGVLQLTTRTLGRSHMPIDIFLHSLASERGSNAIGVILSGTATDGTLGLAAIKGEGGITFAQDLESAKHGGMPSSAISSGCVDMVLPPAGIAAELARIGHHPFIAATDDDREFASVTDAYRQLTRVFDLLRIATRVDFSEYKRATIRRRILRRMALRKLDKLQDYVDYLHNHRDEVIALYQDILINVTSFFRNPEAFDALQQVAYPSILKPRSQGQSVRVWVPGCASGEETYSHAMSLVEYLSANRSTLPIQVFGTDLSESAIQRARTGIYRENIRADVSPARLRRFFTKVEEGYQISKAVRDMCIFATQNLFSDPPFSKLDIVSCRNVLIYLTPELQRRVIPILHYALKPGGFLLVGNTEGLVGPGAELFEIVDKKQKIYRRKAVSSPVSFGYAVSHYAAHATKGAEGYEPKPPGVPGPAPDLQREADRLLLARYVPATVVVNDELDILQSRGHTGPYLELGPGKASLNLLRMARPGLLFELQKGFEVVKRNGRTLRKEGLHIEYRGDVRIVSFEIIPFESPVNQQRSYLIVFEDAPKEKEKGKEKEKEKKKKKGRTIQDARDAQIAQLKQELSATKEYLQSIIQTSESVNEDLQSANEEIQSGNEELQSTNEELQTSKEELESANEELNTVNDEMQHRNQQLSQANNDLINLLNSVSIPTIMLGPDLSIRRFTPEAEKVFGLTSADVGRPATHLRLKVNIPDLEQALLDVIRDVVKHQREIQSSDGAWYSLRITPYKTAENKIDGAVVTMIDISDLKESTEGLASESARLTQVLRQMSAGIAITEAPSGRLIRTSDFLGQVLGSPLYPAKNVAEYSNFRGLGANRKSYTAKEWPMARALKGETITDEEIEWIANDGRRIPLKVTSVPVKNRRGGTIGVVTLFFNTDGLPTPKE